MPATEELIDAMTAHGFEIVVTVPCSMLGSLIDGVEGRDDLDHVGAANEGDAVAIAAGAWLAGRRAVVAFQNSGLGNAVNPLTSLCLPFAIPLALVISWRGQPGHPDAPQHRRMGAMTPTLLELMDVAVAVPENGATPAATFEALLEGRASSGRSTALLLPRGLLPRGTSEPGEAARAMPGPTRPVATATGSPPWSVQPPPSRGTVLRRLLEVVDRRTAVVGTTGKCSRELFTLADRPGSFYQVGSMGCASLIAFGVARWGRRPVVVVDGDGALLMRMGALATIGAHAPERLVHVLLDNGVHDSTGGQPTVSPSIDLAAMAAACGYRAVRCFGVDAFGDALTAALGAPGPHFLHVTIAPGSMSNLTRPTIPLEALARRFRDFVTAGGAVVPAAAAGAGR